MNHFHVYAYPARAQPGPSRQCGQRVLNTLLCSEADISATHFSISFEHSVERLQQLTRLFIELDGSFVWCGETGGQAWQIDGMLYDSQQHLTRVELKGDGPPQAWRSLLECLNWPQQRLLAHWLQWQCFEEIAEPLPLGWFSPEGCTHNA